MKPRSMRRRVPRVKLRGFAAGLHPEFVVCDGGECVCRMVAGEAQRGSRHREAVHGGALFTLMDHCMAWALRSVTPWEDGLSTLELTIHYLRPAPPGRLVCRSRVVSRGRRIAVLEAEIVERGGSAVARGLGTFFLEPGGGPGERARVKGWEPRPPAGSPRSVSRRRRGASPGRSGAGGFASRLPG
ncbi:MAG: PaaI family thioesterase [Euryarchaeota archaeon]|nr:PaaI family thioesterase [Euryarchaeota archaeon]